MSALLDVKQLAIAGVLELAPKRFGDDRGYFCEVYNKQRFGEETGTAVDFIQTNQSLSADKATLRGLHFQAPPFAQTKLVWVVRGAVFDVAVDVRRGSPTFGRWVGMTLSAENFRQCYVPAGFAHGFCVIGDIAEVVYKCTDVYDPANEVGIAWNDPSIAIAWPVREPLLSKRDAANPVLAKVMDRLPEYSLA